MKIQKIQSRLLYLSISQCQSHLVVERGEPNLENKRVAQKITLEPLRMGGSQSPTLLTPLNSAHTGSPYSSARPMAQRHQFSTNLCRVSNGQKLQARQFCDRHLQGQFGVRLGSLRPPCPPHSLPQNFNISTSYQQPHTQARDAAI